MFFPLGFRSILFSFNAGKPGTSSAKVPVLKLHSAKRVIKTGNAIRQPYFTTINSGDSFPDMPYRVTPETTEHVFQRARYRMAYIFPS